ncbi:hypothetical protein [Geitlerinema sp. PCC 7407]|uniref:hypothetical protein n=1 Tax=Geitlerinema sp. PCC 7407 TaxID=1173025 RepID=UPI00031CDB12|nr:hypothetical protein [Geitlerinema sp. PCC 7407]
MSRTVHPDSAPTRSAKSWGDRPTGQDLLPSPALKTYFSAILGYFGGDRPDGGRPGG